MVPNDLYQLTAQSLKVVFEAATKNSTSVFWIRTPDYQKQLYVSDSFLRIFGSPTSSLLEHPESFEDFVIADDLIDIKNVISNRLKKKNEVQADFNYYRIKTGKERIRQMCDRSFPIFDRQNQVVAIAGISLDMTNQANDTIISPEQFGYNVKNIFEEIDESLSKLNLSVDKKTDFSERTVIPGKTYSVEGFEFKISQRQADCITHALQGKTSKEIARDLALSPRTVEEHLTILKTKLHCANKSQLIQKLSRLFY